MNSRFDHPENGNIKITVKKVSVSGKGAIILTGPSLCGKGEIAKALRTFLSLPKEKHLSMGDILRNTIDKAKVNEKFKDILAKEYSISDAVSIFDSTGIKIDDINKAKHHEKEVIEQYQIENNFISQFQWLEFCVTNGLLVPGEWTEKIIEASLKNNPSFKKGIFILDGYPRSVDAAKSLLATFRAMQIPIIKVINLVLSRQQMGKRAALRGRYDDRDSASLDRRYQFYTNSVLPAIDYLTEILGPKKIATVNAYQPIFAGSEVDVAASIEHVVNDVVSEMGLPEYLLDLK